MSMTTLERTIRRIGQVFVALAIVGATGYGNPIPVPPPASMPLEEMWIDIGRAGTSLHADFAGEFTFDYIPSEVTAMWFPVPEDSTNIGAGQDGAPLPWAWVDDLYPTVLPEQPFLPMIGWQGPFPSGGAVFSVEYEHDLIERPGKFIFFYAVGTGKYFPTYDKITSANFHISLPGGIIPTTIWLDDTQVGPEYYTFFDSSLEISLTSEFGPFTKDLIVHLVPERIPGDATGEGRVDADDAAILVERWGQTGATWEMGDFNGDGLVGPADAAILAANQGYGTDAVGAGVVPEPNALIALAGGLMTLVSLIVYTRRRR